MLKTLIWYFSPLKDLNHKQCTTAWNDRPYSNCESCPQRSSADQIKEKKQHTHTNIQSPLKCHETQKTFSIKVKWKDSIFYPLLDHQIQEIWRDLFWCNKCMFLLNNIVGSTAREIFRCQFMILLKLSNMSVGLDLQTQKHVSKK